MGALLQDQGNPQMANLLALTGGNLTQPERLELIKGLTNKGSPLGQLALSGIQGGLGVASDIFKENRAHENALELARQQRSIQFELSPEARQAQQRLSGLGSQGLSQTFGQPGNVGNYQSQISELRQRLGR